MDWILTETISNIKYKITLCESFIELCETQLANYKDKLNTDNKFEACNYEYWRTCKERTSYEIKDLKELLQEIDEMIEEELNDFDEAEEDLRTLRADAQI